MTEIQAIDGTCETHIYLSSRLDVGVTVLPIWKIINIRER